MRFDNLSKEETVTRTVDLELPQPWRLPEGVRQTFDIVRVHAGTAYIAGHGPVEGTDILMRGRVGDDVTVEDGYRSARLTGLAVVASLERVLGASSPSHGCGPRSTSMPSRASRVRRSPVWPTGSAT